MNRDQLFLLRPSFPDAKAGAGQFHCPSCARIEGLLSFFPFLRSAIAVHYVSFTKPRTEITTLLGDEHQGCPVLVLAEKSKSSRKVQSANGQRFIADVEAISAWLGEAFGISVPHP